MAVKQGAKNICLLILQISSTYLPINVCPTSGGLLYDIDIKHLDILLWLFLVRPRVLNLLNDVETLCRTTKYGMLPV